MFLPVAVARAAMTLRAARESGGKDSSALARGQFVGEVVRSASVWREWARIGAGWEWWLGVENGTAARCVCVSVAFRGFRFAQPPATKRHRFAMRSWWLLVGRTCTLHADPDARRVAAGRRKRECAERVAGSGEMRTGR
jgi:hypothetical protein